MRLSVSSSSSSFLLLSLLLLLLLLLDPNRKSCSRILQKGHCHRALLMVLTICCDLPLKRSVIEEILARPLHMKLDDPPTEDEVTEAFDELQCGKSAGPDGILPGVFKAGGQTLIQKFTEFLCTCCEDGCLPQDLKDERIVHLYKGKGDKSSCHNCRGISLAGRILSKVILNRLNTHLLDEAVPESQCGFHQNREAVHMIFTARQIQKKCKEQHRYLYILFVDLTKAFDSVTLETVEHPSPNWNPFQDGENDQMLSRWHERKISQRQ